MNICMIKIFEIDIQLKKYFLLETIFLFSYVCEHIVFICIQIDHVITKQVKSIASEDNDELQI